MSLRCWLFGHEWSPAFETDLTEYEGEKTTKCKRCAEYVTWWVEGGESDDQ